MPFRVGEGSCGEAGIHNIKRFKNLRFSKELPWPRRSTGAELPVRRARGKQSGTWEWSLQVHIQGTWDKFEFDVSVNVNNDFCNTKE